MWEKEEDKTQPPYFFASHTGYSKAYNTPMPSPHDSRRNIARRRPILKPTQWRLLLTKVTMLATRRRPARATTLTNRHARTNDRWQGDNDDGNRLGYDDNCQFSSPHTDDDATGADAALLARAFFAAPRDGLLNVAAGALVEYRTEVAGDLPLDVNNIEEERVGNATAVMLRILMLPSESYDSSGARLINLLNFPEFLALLTDDPLQATFQVQMVPTPLVSLQRLSLQTAHAWMLAVGHQLKRNPLINWLETGNETTGWACEWFDCLTTSTDNATLLDHLQHEINWRTVWSMATPTERDILRPFVDTATTMITGCSVMVAHFA